MIKAVGFRDVLFVLENFGYEKITERELLNPAWDEKVKSILWDLGIDTRFEFNVRANNYRDLNDKSGVGFRYVGEMRQDKAWTSGKGCSFMERISIISDTDSGFARELAEMVGSSVDFTEEALVHEENLPKADIEETYETEALQIEVLNQMVEEVRGKIAYI